ncbi:M23 family metallopeptidase [Brachybacterium sp. AOP43-C2-M15]|uniref:M23 family metallopeptidase n=1 Tax=Brachybacterium sp. AOP43-C2-M15 TaxID=3457661 RepID=UPI004034A4E3
MGSDSGAADGNARRGEGPDGTVVAVLAHLRRGSLQVAPGDRVTAGQQLAECGNSGNSSDPHVHFQLMDGEDIATAHGLPFEWEYRDTGGAVQRGVPANEELFVVDG